MQQSPLTGTRLACRKPKRTITIPNAAADRGKISPPLDDKQHLHVGWLYRRAHVSMTPQ